MKRRAFDIFSIGMLYLAAGVGLGIGVHIGWRMII